MDSNYVENRKKEILSEFDKVKEAIKIVEGQAAELNAKHSALMDSVKRLQGAYAELNKVDGGTTEPAIEPEVVEEK